MTIVEESFPVVNKPLTADQWSSVTLGFGNGSYDEGTGDYRVNVDNASNSISVEPPSPTGFAHATVAGFYHRIHSRVVFPCPAVTQKTTYYLSICYDPAREESMPLKLELNTTLDFSGGRKHLVICEFDREPNQLVSQMTRRWRKPRIAPTLDVHEVTNLPPAASQMFATLVYVNSERSFYRVSLVGERKTWARVAGSRQAGIQMMPGWAYSQASPNRSGIITTPITDGFKCDFSGTFARNAFSYTVGEDWHRMGAFIPENLRTKDYREIIFPALYNTRLNGAKQLICRIQFSTGNIDIRSVAGTTEIEQGGDFHIPTITWVADKSNIIDW
jgi:hypothetical protein